MADFVAEHIEIIARWGNAIVLLFMLFSFAALWLLGRRQRFLIPRHLPGKLLSLTLVMGIVVAGAAIFLLNVRLSPYIETAYKLHQAQGEQIPEITFQLVSDDSQRRVSDFRGNVIVLNLWATWCPPCVGEMNTLNRVYASRKDRGLVVITLSDEPRDKLLKFAKDHPLETISGYVASFQWLKIEAFRPYTLVIDRRGVLREHIFGSRDYDSFVQTIDKYLSEN